jgi:hypothetical protein
MALGFLQPAERHCGLGALKQVLVTIRRGEDAAGPELPENLHGSVNSVVLPSKPDIHHDQSRPLRLCQAHSLVGGSRDASDIKASVRKRYLNLIGNQEVILHNEDASRRFDVLV